MKEACEAKMEVPPPDRSPSCRAIIVHPLFQHKHPIYHCFASGKQYEKFHYVSIPGFLLPFVVQQNFLSSKEHLGSVVWTAGISAACFMTSFLRSLQNDQKYANEQGARKRPLRILELGCGTAALVSQCAALSGAQAYMTDLPEVLEWAKQNARTNLANQNGGPQSQSPVVSKQSPPGTCTSRKIGPNLWAMVLRWGEASDLEKIQQTLQEDNDDNNTPCYFDIVVAADCLYATSDNPDLQSKLLETLKGLLLNGRTKVFFSYQLRTGEEKKFVERVLPSLFPNYMVEEVNHRSGSSVMDSTVYSMLWFRPKDDLGVEAY